MHRAVLSGPLKSIYINLPLTSTPQADLFILTSTQLLGSIQLCCNYCTKNIPSCIFLSISWIYIQVKILLRGTSTRTTKKWRERNCQRPSFVITEIEMIQTHILYYTMELKYIYFATTVEPRFMVISVVRSPFSVPNCKDYD